MELRSILDRVPRRFTMDKMPDHIQNTYDNLTGFQKTYCEYRSKGLNGATAAEKAGSGAKDRQGLSQVGFQLEQLPGVKDLIAYLREQRAKTLPIDDLEVVSKLRAVYDEAMALGKLREANTALEMMGTIVGLFGSARSGPKTKSEESNPFKDEGLDEGSSNERAIKLVSMLKDLEGNKQ